MVKHSRRLVLRIAQSAKLLWSRLIGRLENWQMAPPKPNPATGTESCVCVRATTGTFAPESSASSVTAPIDTKPDYGARVTTRLPTNLRYKVVAGHGQTEVNNQIQRIQASKCELGLFLRAMDESRWHGTSKSI